MGARKRILEEAVRLFGEHGYEGTSLQTIAEAVGIRKQSLFHHFNSKAVLRHAVVMDLLGHWQKELPRLLAEASSGYDRFSSTIEALVEFFLEDTNRAKVAIREMLDRPKEARALISEELKPWITLVVNYINAGQKSGIIKKDVAPESFILLVMMMSIGTVAVGSVVSAMTEADNDEAIESMIHEMVRVARDSFFTNRPKHENFTGRENG